MAPNRVPLDPTCEVVDAGTNETKSAVVAKSLGMMAMEPLFMEEEDGSPVDQSTVPRGAKAFDEVATHSLTHSLLTTHSLKLRRSSLLSRSLSHSLALFLSLSIFLSLSLSRVEANRRLLLSALVLFFPAFWRVFFFFCIFFCFVYCRSTLLLAC